MEENNVINVNQKKSSAKKNIIYIILATLLLLAYIIFTVAVTIDYSAIMAMPEGNDKQLQIGFFLSITVIIFGFIVYGAIAIVSLICWIASIITHKKVQTYKLWKIFFAVTTFLPIITEILLIILMKSATN